VEENIKMDFKETLFRCELGFRRGTNAGLLWLR
jgi:hypothetical protein